ncbi:hypothetical protein Pcinc_033800 [Petrolisthes cinctipes]|uniref:Protein TSSC4 n=1 Tax=Petrolisthes cinctipes TaxID=88211 RepID=A0AAE1ERP1_PETCI|nr:hypothetical protein Pcinc_035771 [Petrolisthes cinctipes]KAK3860131.1 hypothetical protein Pcinc_033800 [Petrolisthes cinctipes]
MSSFRLQSGDTEFNSRVDALFSSLQTVAVDLHTTQAAQGTKRPHDDDDDDNDGDEANDGEFCKHQGMPPPWRGVRGRGTGSRGRGSLGPRNTTPDYIKNPSNWTRYTMKDTKVLSDRENKIEGLKLYSDLQSRRLQEEEGGGGGSGEGVSGEEPEASCDKIVFKKPLKPPTDMDTEMEEEPDQDESSADALFGGPRKFRLPQYEVGKSKSKSKAKQENDEKDEKAISSKEVKLRHLMFEEEEDDD